MATKMCGNKPAAKHSNLLLTDEKGLGVLHLNFMVLPLSVDSVILEHVGHVVGGDEGVVDGDELDIKALERNPGHKPADPVETW